jgi:hypothetical protein
MIRATFNYGDAVQRPASATNYEYETIRQARIMLEPLQTRIRTRGVDYEINAALNALARAMARIEHA